MQDDRPKRGSAHARVGHAHHVGDAGSQEFRGDRQVAPLRHARRPLRTRHPEHHHRVGLNVELRIVDPGGQIIDVLEDDRGSGVFLERARGRAFRLITAPFGARFPQSTAIAPRD